VWCLTRSASPSSVSPQRGVQVSFRMSLINHIIPIPRLPSAVVGRRPVRRHSKVATLVHRPPYYGSSTTTARPAVSLKSSRSSHVEEEESRLIRRRIGAQPRAIRTAAVPISFQSLTRRLPASSPDQHPPSSHPFPLRSLTKDEDWRRAPSPGASKVLFGARIRLHIASYKPRERARASPAR
jgi:hypothetical protein